MLFSYGLWNARNLLLGPSIEIYNPSQSEIETTKNTITVKGQVKNMTFLSLNGRSIFASADGLFEEKLLLYPGSNIIEIKAKDRFKKEVQKILKVYYKQD